MMNDYPIIKRTDARKKGWSIQKSNGEFVDNWIWPDKRDAEKRRNLIMKLIIRRINMKPIFRMKRMYIPLYQPRQETWALIQKHKPKYATFLLEINKAFGRVEPVYWGNWACIGAIL